MSIYIKKKLYMSISDEHTKYAVCTYSLITSYYVRENATTIHRLSVTSQYNYITSTVVIIPSTPHSETTWPLERFVNHYTLTN